MKLEHGKIYVTQGGWLVEIIKVSNSGSDYYFATQRTSPGTSSGRDALQYVACGYIAWAKHCGWQYYDDGSSIYQYLDNQMAAELKIVGEYPFKLADPPKGYAWAGGFPRIEEPINGRTYLAADSFPRAVKMSAGTGWTNNPVIGNRRILLEKVGEPTTPQPEHSVEVTYQYYVPTEKYKWDVQNKYFVKKGDQWYGWSPRVKEEVREARDEYWQGLIKDGVIVPCTREQAIERVGLSKQEAAESPQAEQYYVPTDLYTGGQKRYFVKRQGVWYGYADGKEYTDGSNESFWQRFIAEGKIKPSTKEEAMARVGAESPPKPVVATPPIQTVERDKLSVVQKLSVPKEEKMKSSTFVSLVKSAASRTLGAANHFYVEPAKIIGGYVKRSVRYAIFFGTLTGIVYGVNDPTSLKKKVASCMPKITIEAPEALK